LGYKTLKIASKAHSERLIRPSKTFVWDSNWEGGHFGASGKTTHENVDKNSR